MRREYVFQKPSLHWTQCSCLHHTRWLMKVRRAHLDRYSCNRGELTTSLRGKNTVKAPITAVQSPSILKWSLPRSDLRLVLRPYFQLLSVRHALLVLVGLYLPVFVHAFFSPWNVLHLCMTSIFWQIPTCSLKFTSNLEPSSTPSLILVPHATQEVSLPWASVRVYARIYQ